MSQPSQATHQPELETLHHSLSGIISRRMPATGDWTTPVPNLTFFRRDQPAPPTICLVEPSIVMVTQGVKRMLVGEQGYRYDTSRFLITSLDLPANSEVINASAEEPCLGFLLKLDLRLLAEIITQSHLPPATDRAGGKSVGLGTVTHSLLEPCHRLLALLDEPEAIEILAPLIQREIHFRLLMSDQAPLLRQIASVDSQGYRISKAIDWLKIHYASSLRIEELAARVQMSTATFHHHFRQLTGMSPLQYQKWMRLNEAKRLMLNEHMDAASASYEVGYESPSQFSREYSRLFGAPPKRDIETLRKQAAVPG